MHRFDDGGGTPAVTKTVTIDAVGNITGRSHLLGSTSGTYNYTGTASCSEVTGNVAPPGPHAMRTVTARTTKLGADRRVAAQAWSQELLQLAIEVLGRDGMWGVSLWRRRSRQPKTSRRRHKRPRHGAASAGSGRAALMESG